MENYYDPLEGPNEDIFRSKFYTRFHRQCDDKGKINQYFPNKGKVKIETYTLRESLQNYNDDNNSGALDDKTKLELKQLYRLKGS